MPPNIELSANYDAILSNRGKEIMNGVCDLTLDEQFWRNSSSKEISEKVLSVIGSKSNEELAPKGCTSHTHRKVEGFLLASLVKEMFIYYQSSKTVKARKDMSADMPKWYYTRHFKSVEIEAHIESNKGKAWW